MGAKNQRPKTILHNKYMLIFENDECPPLLIHYRVSMSVDFISCINKFLNPNYNIYIRNSNKAYFDVLESPFSLL